MQAERCDKYACIFSYPRRSAEDRRSGACKPSDAAFYQNKKNKIFKKNFNLPIDKTKKTSYNCAHLAGIAQLVEHDLAKVGVEGPSPFSRSKKEKPLIWVVFFFYAERKVTRTREEGPLEKYFTCEQSEHKRNIFRTRHGACGMTGPEGEPTAA